MVGIAVVAPNFDPTAQVKSTFRVMCKTTSSETVCGQLGTLALASVG